MDIIPSFSTIMWTLILSTASGVAGLVIIAIYNRALCKRCVSKASLNGKTVIVTGCSSGIGKEAVRDFAKRGAKIIMACRNLPKTQNIADEIILESGNSNIHVKVLDSSLMSSVRSFAKQIVEEEERLVNDAKLLDQQENKHTAIFQSAFCLLHRTNLTYKGENALQKMAVLDVLVLNAGIGGPSKRDYTTEGLELTLATNHLGHFLLINLLMGLLVKSKPSRVVITASQMHSTITKLDPKNLNFENGGYGSLRAYGLSKLCNVLTARHQAAHYCDKGVTFNCFCPGLVDTGIFQKLDGFTSSLLYKILLPVAARSPEDGAQTLIHLAVSEELANISGAYFIDCKERVASKFANDAGMIKKIWEKSEELVKLSPKEKTY